MKVLLHTCCAPCTTHCIEALRKLGHKPTLFFSNANISPAEEFNKRFKEVIKLAGIMNVPLLLDDPDHDEWLAMVAQGLEAEPEKGLRCSHCFEYALQRTYHQMKKMRLNGFTTTLTVSPHKASDLIAKIGKRISESYLDINFKKQDGFKNSLELSKEYKLYRQSYCGCEFSLRDNRARLMAQQP
ncbi:MAG: epoxyqueuosine reductase QueH [Kiritimatiellae bacterium]|jgi:predicted adenine nucleotide alpha hydrolase (AANH) superfamily ATPase|nr:epoxyqueuosine reductase QueH [Kiritimatiellia bacterium]